MSVMTDFIELPDVLTQRTIPVSTLNVPRQADVNQWSYLKQVKLYDIDAGIDFLIGTDAPKVMEPWELINGQDDGPYAVRTRVSWVVKGPLRGGSSGSRRGSPTVTTNGISIEHLQEMLVKQYNQDFNELWYIPLHGVYHPRKGKLRVVFNCGTTYKGTSLNCQLLQGPDLTSSLIGVLVRFRQEPVAIMADIQAMFHQVHVSDKHINFLRFLWWPNGDTAVSPGVLHESTSVWSCIITKLCKLCSKENTC